MTPEQEAAIRELARKAQGYRAATEDPWDVWIGSAYDVVFAEAEYIAALSPAVALDLLAALDATRAREARLRAALLQIEDIAVATAKGT